MFYPSNFFSPDPSCDFERDFCSWKQLTTDDFDWTRNKGKTSSDGTGPSTDHSGNGYYIYIETSSPREEDDIAMLRFQGKSDKPSVCLSFYFHMYGNDVGEIYLYNRGRTVWRMAGNQGDLWRRAEIKITGDYD
ncbi:unnamed protein product, partial [Porites evermanni]